MSWLKKAIVYLSVTALAAPVVASGTVGIASAATTDNAKTTETAKPNASLKAPFRDANNIFKLRLDKQKDGYVLVTNIAASGNNVIQKGEQLVVNFDKKNVDLNNSSVVNQDGSAPFTVKKDANKGTVTLTFNQTVDSGNYTTAVGIATKNLYTTSSLKADFQGAPIKISDNLITSKWQAPTYNSTNGDTTQQSSSYSTQNSVGTTQVASTQAASSQYSTSTSSTQAATSYTTTTSQTGTTTQATNQSQGYTPTFDEAEKAVMNRTTINVTGTATDSTETQTSANVATPATDTQSGNVNNALINSNNTESTAVQAQANQAAPAENSTGQTTTQAVATDQTAAPTTANTTVATAPQSNTTQATNNTVATTQTNNVATTQPVASNTGSTQASQTTDNQTSAQAEINVPLSVSTNNAIQTPNGKASDPAQTLQDVLAENDSNPQGDKTTYEPNKTFENIKKDINAKASMATPEEQAEIVKVTPWIWSYISKQASQNQVFTFATLLTTGRTAYTTINGTADANSSNILEQQMPTLLKSFGENITDGAFDKAMDIDVLLDSQLYKDYLDGKYTPTSEKLNPSDAWAAMKDHITVTKVDDNTNTAGATQLDKTYFNAKATLDSEVAAQLAKQNAEKVQKELVTNSETSENVATTDNNANSNGDNTALFNQMQKDMADKMADTSVENQAQVLDAIPEILNDVSNKTASSDKTGGVSNFIKPMVDGTSYLISVDTQPITGSSDKYLANLPQIFKSFGDSMRKGDFDQPLAMQNMERSQIYQDYLDGKYVPDSLVTKKTVNNKDDLLPAILLAMVAIPALTLLMGVVTILTSPIWVPLAIATWGVVFAITAMPIVFIYTVLGALILPSLVLFPIMAIVSLIAAPILLIGNLIPIVNLITIPITLINLALTFIPGWIVLTFIPMLLLAAGIVIAGIAIPVIMTIGLVIAQVVAGILSFLTGGLLAMLLPITALLGIIIAGAFSLLGLIGFILIAGGIMALVLGLIVAGFAVLTVVAGGFAGVIGLGLIAGIAVVLLGYLAFNFGGMLAGIAIFLILLVLMPQFLVLNFLLWFIGFGFMALILTDLAIPSLELALAIGALMMMFFVPGLLIALSWPFWMGLVLQISIPIVEIAFLIALPFSFIPLFGWIADAIVGVIILIQAIALVISVALPLAIGVGMMTKGIIGFDIAMAAAAVLDLIKDKEVTDRKYVDLDTSWRRRIHPVGFWTKSDPLATALA
ncbi:hypothetical protein [Companilactobacillus sp.]|jgi:hypothetical protein|uniref:hypothetical protein n=1 Tax=Companilactobacillus sp. TaxID=2767905 RepID=UPI0025BDF81E|nr:hypothetical protein [Companilactobacillus sp.]MCH4009352.1 hypothetical protein [Companilactobacillus sp.]MCH4050469.1 hypothetical protein [Companilactobacillus sp.]MCH4077294.1 hypothetical protein [Companilactobacillus sp.]MCH4125870.1 hypothetical protein [Companilactobacillus sp.]MCI1311579.1 hypothetical protein [Companilactobacillus sp.]